MILNLKIINVRMMNFQVWQTITLMAAISSLFSAHPSKSGFDQEQSWTERGWNRQARLQTLVTTGADTLDWGLL